MAWLDDEALPAGLLVGALRHAGQTVARDQKGSSLIPAAVSCRPITYEWRSRGHESATFDAYPAALQLLAAKCQQSAKTSYGITLWAYGYQWSGAGATKLGDTIAAAGRYLTKSQPYYDRYLA